MSYRMIRTSPFAALLAVLLMQFTAGARFAAGQISNIVNTTTTLDNVQSALTGFLSVNGSVTPTLYVINNSTLTAGLTFVTVGGQTNGALSLLNGGKIINSSIVQLGEFDSSGGNSSGTVNVAGGSTWTASGNFFVGAGGKGALNISSGGVVSNSNGYIAFGAGGGSAAPSTGAVTIDGAGSAWNNNRLFVGGNNTGAGGNGSLLVTSGGAVNVSETLRLWSSGSLTLNGGSITARSFDRTAGSFTFSGGTVTVSGGRYKQAAGTLTIAGSGSPTLRLTNSGQIDSSVDGVQGVVLGATSGNGALSVESGSVLEMTGFSGTLGQSAGSTGTAVVTGPGSHWNATGVLVGGGGNGSLSVLGGGAMQLNSYLSLGEGGVGAVTVSGAGSQINFGTPSTLYLGSSSQGTLTVLNGGSVGVHRVILGAQYGASGTATISGTGSALVVTNTLAVGGGGNGTLNLTSRGSATAGVFSIGDGEGSVGNVAISGTGSQLSVDGFTFIGNVSRGRLDVLDGGKLSAASHVFIGQTGSYSGTLQVGGAGSEVAVAGQLRIGEATAGTLTILDGGKVSADRVIIGSQYVQKMRTAAVDGTGSLLAVTNTLAVGGGDLGLLEVRNHARVTAGQLLVADNADATGTLTVSGAGSNVTVTGNLTVGNRSRGTMNVLDGGTISNQNGFIAAPGSQYPGIANVTGTGSVWTMTGGLYVGGNATGSGGNATLNVGSGGTVNVAGLTKIWSAGTIHIASGGTLHTGTFEVVNGGTLTVDSGGSFDGTLQTAGNFTLNGNLSGSVNVSGTTAAFAVAAGGSVAGNVSVASSGAAFVNNGTVAGNVSTVVGSTLGGSGVVTGSVSGAGLVSPGNSPGILTVSQVDPTTGMDFLFQFTVANSPPDYSQPTNSLNDVLHLTHGTNPFLAALTSSNTVTIDFQVGALSDGDYFLGAFFANQSGTDFVGDGTVSGADFEYLFNGVGLDPGHWQVSVTSISQTGVDFGSGPINGRVTKFMITDVSTVPEPGSIILCGTAAAGFYLRRRRKLAAK